MAAAGAELPSPVGPVALPREALLDFSAFPPELLRELAVPTGGAASHGQLGYEHPCCPADYGSPGPVAGGAGGASTSAVKMGAAPATQSMNGR